MWDCFATPQVEVMFLKEIMSLEPSYFIDEIYNLEAEGMLADLSLNPNLFIHFMDFIEADRERALSYIKSVLSECYRCGHLKVAVSHENEELYGYALMFAHPDEKYPKYLHKIFVKEQFRGRGIGTEMLKSITNSSRVGLLCPADKIHFYENNGFTFSQEFSVPDDQAFQLSKELYSSLYVMKNHSDNIIAPIFLLNDEDVRHILGV